MSNDIKIIQCEEAIQKMLEYLDEEVYQDDKEAIHNHLDSCRECYTRMEFEQRLKGMVRESKSNSAPSGLGSRIKKIVKDY